MPDGYFVTTHFPVLLPIPPAYSTCLCPTIISIFSDIRRSPPHITDGSEETRTWRFGMHDEARWHASPAVAGRRKTHLREILHVQGRFGVLSRQSSDIFRASRTVTFKLTWIPNLSGNMNEVFNCQYWSHIGQIATTEVWLPETTQAVALLQKCLSKVNQ